VSRPHFEDKEITHQGQAQTIILKNFSGLSLARAGLRDDKIIRKLLKNMVGPPGLEPGTNGL